MRWQDESFWAKWGFHVLSFLAQWTVFPGYQMGENPPEPNNFLERMLLGPAQLLRLGSDFCWKLFVISLAMGSLSHLKKKSEAAEQFQALSRRLENTDDVHSS